MKSVPIVAFDYRPSRWLICALAICTTLAVASLLLTAMPAAAQWVIGVSVAIYFPIAILRLHRDAPTRLAWQSAGHWRVVCATGDEHHAELRNATVRGAWIVLNLERTDGKRIDVILLPDNSTPDVRRHLRVRLSRGLSPTRA